MEEKNGESKVVDVVAAEEKGKENGQLVSKDGEVELTKEDNAIIDTAVGAIGPVAMRLGFGGFVGFCSGYAIKQASKVVALTLGVGFVCLQSLQYVGYVEVKWSKIRIDVMRTISTDGSGQVTVKDVRHYITRIFNVLRFHGPPAAGFSTGLYLGFNFD